MQNSDTGMYTGTSIGLPVYHDINTSVLCSMTFKSVNLMASFFSETSTNRLNSSNFKTLIALQTCVRWLLLHSCFSTFSWPPNPPYKKRLTSHQIIETLHPLPPQPHTHLGEKKNDNTEYFYFLRSTRDCQLSKFVICDP